MLWHACGTVVNPNSRKCIQVKVTLLLSFAMLHLITPVGCNSYAEAPGARHPRDAQSHGAGKAREYTTPSPDTGYRRIYPGLHGSAQGFKSDDAHAHKTRTVQYRM